MQNIIDFNNLLYLLIFYSNWIFISNHIFVHINISKQVSFNNKS